MPTTYVKPEPNEQVYQLLRQVMREHHHRLQDAKVRVGVLFAASDTGPALKSGGYACYANVRNVPLMWRMLCDCDALMLIDGREWEDMDANSRVALLDHELSHLDVVDKESPTGSVIVARDDIGRPKLQMVDGDWNGGDAFMAVIARHGTDAIEYANAKKVFGKAQAALELETAETS